MIGRRIKVLVVEQARGVWGAQRYLLRLAPLLSERGIDLTLAGPGVLELHADWNDAGFQSIKLDIPLERSIRIAGRPSVPQILAEGRRGFTAARRIADLTRGGGYDALWANGHWTHVDTGIAGQLSRTPVVLHLHEEVLLGAGRLMRSAAVSLSARTVAVSRAVSEGLPRLVANRVTVIPNGVDTKVMSPSDTGESGVLRSALGIRKGEVMILAATRLDPSKRIEDLIDGVAALGNSGVRLVIAGKTSVYPDYEQQVRAHAATLGAESITFCGNRANMVALFRASDLIVHAGTVEGMPLTVVEAQACGKPVIAYDVAGVVEALIDGATGLLVPACDVGGLTAAIKRLVEDASLRVTMGAAARRHALAHHDIATQADRNAAVLMDVCGVAGPYRRG